MAAVQAPQPPGRLPARTDAREGRQGWDHSVPVNNEGQKPGKTSTDGVSLSSNQSQNYGRSPISQANGNTSYPQSIPRSSHSTNATGDERLLPPPSLLRKDSDVSRGGSEPDSLLDLYGSHSANRSRVGSMDGDKRPSHDTLLSDEYDPENSRWIHRDKLLRIEHEELQRAGIHIGRDSRPGSRHLGRRERSGEVQPHGSREHGGKDTAQREEKRQRLTSPVPDGGEDEDDAEPVSFDLRTLEEIAANPYEDGDGNLPYGHSRWAASNTSHSRIPVHKSSPLPIPQDFIERGTPLQRRASGEDQSIAYKNPSRSRSMSLSSQMLLDEAEQGRPATPPADKAFRATPPTSPTKAKASGHGSRKASISRVGQQKVVTRPANRDSPATRPTTRSGEIKRPEGDPPWLASMYKPDPRLPPDQQLLPTVAKRLQQEQWEREGKFGDTYDRELNPLSVHSPETENGPEPEYLEEPSKPSPADSPKAQQALEVPAAGEAGEWPLRRSRGSSIGRPGTSGTEHGGYKVMPTVRDAQASPTPTPLHTVRVKDPGGETKEGKEGAKEKGAACACCLVM